MTPTATPESELTPELIDRVMKLPAEDQDRLVDAIYDSMPPGPDEVEIQRRLDSVLNGTAKLLTRDEADEAVRRALRAQGIDIDQLSDCSKDARI
jgi:hypothetical protein